MDQIRVNAPELEACAAQLDICRDELYATFGAMETVIKSNMPDCWEGETVIAFGDQFDEIKNQFLDRVIELIEDMTQQSRSVCEAFRELDTGMSNTIRG